MNPQRGLNLGGQPAPGRIQLSLIWIYLLSPVFHPHQAPRFSSQVRLVNLTNNSAQQSGWGWGELCFTNAECEIKTGNFVFVLA